MAALAVESFHGCHLDEEIFLSDEEHPFGGDGARVVIPVVNGDIEGGRISPKVGAFLVFLSV